MSAIEYGRENVVSEVESLAEERLESPTTLELRAWNDGDFEVVVFHTIDAKHNVERGTPFHRERLVFKTVGEHEGWIRHEVVRRGSGQTGSQTLHSERIGGYTPNWPAPIEDDDGTISLWGVGPDCPGCGGPTHAVTGDENAARPWWCNHCNVRLDDNGEYGGHANFPAGCDPEDVRDDD